MGIIRARKTVVLIGEKEEIKYAVNNNDSQKTNTRLYEKLSDMHESK